MGGVHKQDEWSEQKNKDTQDIQKAFDSKTIPEGYFVKSEVADKLDNANGDKGRGLSDEAQRTILGNICALAEFVPGGSILSKGLTCYNIFMPPPAKTEQSDDTKAIIRAVEKMEANLLKYYKDKDYTNDSNFLQNLTDTIADWRKEGKFEMQKYAQKQDVEDVVKTLASHTDAAASTDGFRSNFKNCRERYEYGDVKRLVLLMGLMNAYATCMLLQAVCKANLSVAADNAGKSEEAQGYRASFKGRLVDLKTTLETQISTTNGWVNEKKQNRRDGIWNYQMGPVWYSNSDTKHEGHSNSWGGQSGSSWTPGFTERNHLWMFEDKVTNKRMETTAREMALSGTNYQAECDEIMRCMKDWKAYYVKESEKNIEEQFSALLKALETWTTFCNKLGGFINTLDPDFNKKMTSEEAWQFYKRLDVPPQH